ncbi:MAG: F0F1 ATP synthase subunit A [Chloroflexota bacterium]
MSSETVTTEPVGQTTEPEPAAPKGGLGLSSRWFALIGAVIVFDILAFIVAPPFPKGGAAGESCPYPLCFINGTLEFPAPHVVYDFDPATAPPASALITFHPSISSTILTMWIAIAIVLVAAFVLTRGLRLLPTRRQNAFEFVYEFLSDFGTGIAGAAARPYVPIFVGFFLLILVSNWLGLIPPVGRVEELRAPTSDVNVTIGLALVAFAIFEFEGFRRLGVGGYLGKFFPFYEFRNGIGAGLIALFVGLVELMLEFVKPVTLSMRLFGNIYGGEVALGVITALTVAFIPIALISLELLLNAIQALIFSILTLIFITLAIESHHDEEGEVAEEALGALHGEGAPAPAH